MELQDALDISNFVTRDNGSVGVSVGKNGALRYHEKFCGSQWLRRTHLLITDLFEDDWEPSKELYEGEFK